MPLAKRAVHGLKGIFPPLSLLVLVCFFYHLPHSPKNISKVSSQPPQEPIGKNEKPKPNRYPSDWAWRQRTFPHGTADKTALLEALRQAQAMRSLQKPSSHDLDWELAGPTNVGGRISDIEINPENAEVIYAGAATGGVFKSSDGGSTWRPVFDEQAVLPIGDLAIDPNFPDIIYAGTGEANGGHNNLPGAGVFKSDDAGESWQLMGLEATTSIGRIVVDPSNSNRVLVAAIGSYFGPDPDRGVYRSDDGGQSWQQVLFVNDSTGAIDLVIDPQNPSTLFAAVWERVRRPAFGTHLAGLSSGIYRSRDGGETWQRLGTSNGLPEASLATGRIGLAICATQPEQLYALYINNSDYGGLYRSRNGGDNWERADPDNEVRAGFGRPPFSWYFGNVRVHPENPEQVYVLDVSFMASFDGGNTWPIIYGYGGPPILHVDHHALAFDPDDPQRLIEGNDGGINISENAGLTWTKVEALPMTQFYQITMDVTNPERLYGGTQDNGTVRTLTGNLDDWEEIYGGDGFYVIVDPSNPNVIYAESQFGGLGKSTNGGRTFLNALDGINGNEPTNWSTPVVMDPNNSNVLYYGTHRVYRTTDGAGFWRPISGILTNNVPGSQLRTVTTIAVAPGNSNVVYAGTDDGNVWMTPDGGTTWRKISATLPYRWVTRVAVDPTDERVAYVTFSGLKWKSPQPHVFRTTDMGASWTDISSNLPDAPANTIVVDPLYPNFLYLGTDVSAYYSDNYGETWAPLGTGLPMVSVYDIVVHPTERVLVAGTHARSMYKLDLSTFTSVETREERGDRIPASIAVHQNYPNPFNPATRIVFDLPTTVKIALQIYNAKGEWVKTLAQGMKPAGSHAVSWDGKDASGRSVTSGVYFYRLIAGLEVQQRKMILLR